MSLFFFRAFDDRRSCAYAFLKRCIESIPFANVSKLDDLYTKQSAAVFARCEDTTLKRGKFSTKIIKFMEWKRETLLTVATVYLERSLYAPCIKRVTAERRNCGLEYGYLTIMLMNSTDMQTTCW